ncbi:glycosyltransferase [Halobellus rubicundus]|uniref:Glycosyltransferase n=1 Tax=Halobellus rubicundus TaxID=2996466 RepID=A0ABD5MEZ8_9EURY
MDTNIDIPGVSVVIPVYNRADVIGRAIDSVLNQTYKNFEIIVVDDGSTDSTPEVVSSYKNKCNLTLVKHDTNKGQNVARNTGLKQSSGDLISYLDSDDEFLPNYLATVVEILNGQPDTIGGVMADNYDDRIDGTTSTGVNYGKVSVSDLSVEGHGLWSCTGLTFRSDILNSIGYHDTSIIKQTDLDFVLQILSKYDLFATSDPLYMRHNDSENQVSKDNRIIIEGTQRIIEKHRDVLSNKAVGKRHYDIGRAHIDLGEVEKAKSRFRKAIELNSSQEIRLRIIAFLISNKHPSLARTFCKSGIRGSPNMVSYYILYLCSWFPVSTVKLAKKIYQNYIS